MNNAYNCIFVIGPTASGKTSLAVKLAAKYDGEIISADSRQVYRRMDIGTGKDLHEFKLDGYQIPYHLIDICEPGEKYNIERFYNDAQAALEDITNRRKLPIICGGSGLYIETLLKGNPYSSIPVNVELRAQLTAKSKGELLKFFHAIPFELQERLDSSSLKKLIRSIEIAHYIELYGEPTQRDLGLKPLILATKIDRDSRRVKISNRLKQRLNEGMVAEVEELLNEGILPEDLKFYGLEYLWITRYCLGEIDYQTMVRSLETAIHQFAKRQMTWFRRMEKQGYELNWMDATIALEDIDELMR
jgi:tRNA dimethylallyltransferase